MPHTGYHNPNALVRTGAPSLPGGAPALSSHDGISSVMHEHGYTTREVLDWLIARCAAAGGSPTPGGSDTQVQFNDAGTLAGDAGLTWDKTNDLLRVAGATSSATLNVKCNASDTAFKMQSGAGDEIFAVGATGSNANLAFGDLDETGNHTLFTSQDTNKLIRFAAPGGQITFGDHQFWANATQVVVDDDLQVVTSNVDIDFQQNEAKQMRIENRTSDPASPAVGEIWLRTDL